MAHVLKSMPTPMPVLDPMTRRVTLHVIKRFPEMRGVMPKQAPGQAPGQQVFTFRTHVDMGAGRMVCVVRVVVDETGHILRTITSH